MTPSITKPKLKKCQICRALFKPMSSWAKACSNLCAQAVAEADRLKAERLAAKIAAKLAAADKKFTRETLGAMRSKPQLTALAQKAFNKFIRARDAGKTCISCDKPLKAGGVGGGFDAGHFRSVGGAVHMRFVEDNCHGQCKHCNNYLSGNILEYRSRLIERIGQIDFDSVMADRTLRKYSKEGLIEIARHYNAEERKLKAIA